MTNLVDRISLNRNKKKLSRIYFLLAFALMTGHLLQAQDKTVKELKSEAGRAIAKDAADTIPRSWKTGGMYNVTFNQAALSNWSAGGDKSSLSLASALNLFAFYQQGKHSWDNTLNLAYAMVNTTSLGMRKADDRIDLVSKYGRDLGKKWYLSTLFNFRSQFAQGYAYSSADVKKLTSDFMAPAYVILSLGLDYKPNDNFSVFVSPASARWIIVNNDSLSSVGAYGVDSGKNTKFQFGAYASVNYTANISKTAVYKGRLDLYSNYLHNPQDISLYMTNILAVKVSRVVNINLSLTMIYDNDVRTVKSDNTNGGASLQLQEVIGIGLAYKFDNSAKAKRKMGKTGG